MDLEITSTGKRFYEVPPLLAGILCEAFPESFKRVEKQPSLSAQYANVPVYAVGITPGGLRSIIRRRGQTTEYISATREQIASLYPDCPSGVIDEFERVPLKDRAAAPQFHTRIPQGVEG